jgi:hypothetical protein
MSEQRGVLFHPGRVREKVTPPPARRTGQRPWLGRGGFFHEGAPSVTRASLHEAGALAAAASQRAARVTRETVAPAVAWLEGLRRTGSVMAIGILVVICGLVLCAAIWALFYAASVVFAPQLEGISHILFFTPST